jgi:hypothetical protein
VPWQLESAWLCPNLCTSLYERSSEFTQAPRSPNTNAEIPRLMNNSIVRMRNQSKSMVSLCQPLICWSQEARPLDSTTRGLWPQSRAGTEPLAGSSTISDVPQMEYLHQLDQISKTWHLQDHTSRWPQSSCFGERRPCYSWRKRAIRQPVLSPTFS